MGSIKTSDGTFYNVFPDKLSQFAKGAKYRIEYEARPKDGGGEWRTIKRIIGNGAVAAPSNNYRARSNPSESKQIAVLAIVKEWVPHIPVGDEDALVHALQVAMRAYDRTLGGVQAQQRDDMADNIPY